MSPITLSLQDPRVLAVWQMCAAQPEGLQRKVGGNLSVQVWVRALTPEKLWLGSISTA